MEAAGSFKPSVYTYQITQHHIPQDSKVYKTMLNNMGDSLFKTPTKCTSLSLL
jgi:hypothetical protein